MSFSKKRALFFIGFFWVCGNAVLWAGGWKGGLWNDGRAEVAVYDAERMMDGTPRQFKETLITQKTSDVFKLNDVQSFDADNYPYHYLASVLVNADRLSEAVKIT